MKEKFASWFILFAQYFKRDWKKIIIWVAGLGLFAGAYVPAFEEIAKGDGALGMFETMQNPAMISMVGPTPVTSGADYTLGAMYAHLMLLFCGLFAMIITIMHVVGHTRKEEDQGLTELVRSFAVGRQANSLAVLLEAVIINVLLGLFTAGVMVSFGVASIDLPGSLLFGASLTIAGIIGAALALVMAQIFATAAGATGASLGIVGLLYILRGTTDISDVALSMFNPMGWTYLTYPFTKNSWLPILYGLLFTVVVVLAAFALEGKRDMGAGYLPEWAGRAHAKKSLLSTPGLFFRLNRGIIIAWLVAYLILGAAYGSIYGDMQTFLESNELLQQMFTATNSSLEASFTSTIMMVMIVLACILPIAIVNRLSAEESRGNLAQFWCTRMTRGKLFWTSIGLAVGAGLLSILAAVVGLGGTALSVMEGKSTMTLGDFMAAGFNFFPALLFAIALAALALGFYPKLGKVVYAYLGYSFVLNYFAGILDLPDWLNKTAVQSWLPRLPVADFDLPTFATITIISVLLIIAGYFGYRQRDLKEGA